MNFANKYNILDKFIAFLRNYSVLNNQKIEGKEILDFGCGSNFDEIFNKYKKASKVFLVDIYGEDFEKDNITYINYNFNFKKIEKKIKDQKFKLIFLLAVIEHLDNPEDIISSLKKYLDKDGIICLTAPSIYSKPILEFMAYKLGIINRKLVEEHKRYYNKNEYIKLSQKTNCKIIKFKYFMLGMNTLAFFK